MALKHPIGLCITLIALGLGTARNFGQAAPGRRLSFRDPAAAELKAAILEANVGGVQRIVNAAATNDCLELDEQGRTALHYAVQRCATEVVDPKPFEILKILARRGHCANAADRLGRKPIFDLEPLTWASRSRMDALEILIASGADVNAQDENGATLLHQLLGSWDDSSLHWPEVLEVLAKAGVNPNIVNSAGQTALHCFFGPLGLWANRDRVGATQVAVVQKVFTRLAGMGAKLTIRDQQGNTPIGEMLARYETFFGTKEIILGFATPALAKSLDVNSAVVKNRPGLIFLCDKSRSDPDLLERWLELGADPKVAEADGTTALHGAAWFYNHRVCALLLERGANVNAVNAKGRTPLHELARSQYNGSGFLDSDSYANVVRAADVLVAHGADRRLKDKDGKRAVDLLRLPEDASSEDQAILRALKKKLKP